MISNHNFPIMVCIEGIDGIGKTTLLSKMRKVLFDNKLPHDTYVDRFIASNYVFNTMQGVDHPLISYSELEEMVQGRAIYLYVGGEASVAFMRMQKKKDDFKYTIDELEKMDELYREYFLNTSKIPVLHVNFLDSPETILNRIDDHRMMLLAEHEAESSECLKRQQGVVIRFEDELLSTGYNRVPFGLDACKECIRKGVTGGSNLEVCRAVHGETIALMYCSHVRSKTMYARYFPCTMCARMMIEYGIKKFFYRHKDVETKLTDQMFAEAGVECQKL